MSEVQAVEYAAKHVCTVCHQDSTLHFERCGDHHHFPALCCPGCDCGSYEEAHPPAKPCAVGDVASDAHRNILEQQEKEIQAALRSVEDREWSLDEVRMRCKLVRCSSYAPGEEIFTVDGKPLLYFGALTTRHELRGESYVLTVSRPFRRNY